MPGLLGTDDDTNPARSLLQIQGTADSGGLLGLVDVANRTALGPLYVPRDPGLGISAGAGRAVSLEQVNPRTLKPLSSEPDLTQPGAHTFSVNNAAGERMGLVDTQWSPNTGNLHIADFQSEGGANTLGPGVVRQIRDQLVALYPGTQTLTGQRITGAVSADRMSGAGPGRAATQVVQDQ